ncbi:MAG: aminoglycoside 6-adenylyltransferase, partial [Thermomicrobiales bacterium]|nr:aminoglycoside 6-adenylyltransferase [Thermomicrobiales bacterium]
AAFWHTPPTENGYLACCNEFWWCLNNVAKANARGQYPMAVSHLESPVRDMLYQMLGWYVGELHAWHVSIGKQGKFLANLLPTEDYALLLSTYPHADRDDIWKAIHGITTLFRNAARQVAVSQGFGYPSHWDEGMSAWLTAVEQGQVPGEMELDNH